MQLKTSFFNGTIFKKNLTRFMPLWGIYCFILILNVPVSIWNYYSNPWDGGIRDLMYTVMAGGESTLTQNVILAVVVSMCIWRYLYSPRSIGMMYTIPVTRNTLFTTNFLSGLLIPLVIQGVVALISIGVSMSLDVASPGRSMLLWFGISAMEYIFFFGLGTLAAMAVGQVLALPVLYGILNSVMFVVTTLVRQAILPWFLYGYSIHPVSYVSRYSRNIWNTIIMTLTPVARMYQDTGPVYNEVYEYIGVQGIPILIGYALTGLLFAGIAMAMHRRKKMELAGEVVSVVALRPVLLYAMTFGSALVLGTFLSSIVLDNLNGSKTMMQIIMVICTLICAAVGYFGTQMMIQKKVHIWKTANMKGYIIAATCIVLIFAALKLDVVGYNSKIPKASDVSYASVSYGYGSGEHRYFTSEEGVAQVVQQHQMFVENKDMNEKDANEETRRATITYLLNNGKLMQRSYLISKSLEAQYRNFETLYNEREAMINTYANLPIEATNAWMFHIERNTMTEEGYYEQPISLSSEDRVDFYYNCILPDLKEGNIGREDLIAMDNSTLDSASTQQNSLRIYIYYDGSDELPNFDYSVLGCRGWNLVVNEEAVRTLEWLQDHGIPLEKE